MRDRLFKDNVASGSKDFLATLHQLARKSSSTRLSSTWSQAQPTAFQDAHQLARQVGDASGLQSHRQAYSLMTEETCDSGMSVALLTVYLTLRGCGCSG